MNQSLPSQYCESRVGGLAGEAVSLSAVVRLETSGQSTFHLAFRRLSNGLFFFFRAELSLLKTLNIRLIVMLQ